MAAAVEVTQYEELVARGREAREQADDMQWIEGDLALQIEALPPDERPRDPATGKFIEDEAKALKRYADDVDIPHATLQEYRRVALAWPVSLRRGTVSYQAHRVLAAQEDRFDLITPGMTVSEATKVVRTRGAASYGQPGWFELLGMVGDTLLAAQKQLVKAEVAIDEPNADLREKAHDYAGIADGLAARLRGIAA